MTFCGQCMLIQFSSCCYPTCVTLAENVISGGSLVCTVLQNSIKVMMLRTLVMYAECAGVLLQNLHLAHDILFRKLIFNIGQEFIMFFLDQKKICLMIRGIQRTFVWIPHLMAQGGSKDNKKVGIFRQLKIVINNNFSESHLSHWLSQKSLQKSQETWQAVSARVLAQYLWGIIQLTFNGIFDTHLMKLCIYLHFWQGLNIRLNIRLILSEPIS